MEDRIIEMLERGERVELECVDRDGFASHGHVNEKLLSYGKVIIEGYSKDEFSLRLADSELDLLNICRAQAYINSYELQYFKIKEPDFNDLIDVAVQAVRDEVLSRYIYYKTGNGDEVIALYVGEDLKMQFFTGEEKRGIERIKSLYTETFVIEHQSDLSKIKLNDKKTKIELANGTLVSDEILDMLKDQSGKTQLSILKGARVTQNR